jgi:hypothetical protein
MTIGNCKINRKKCKIKKDSNTAPKKKKRERKNQFTKGKVGSGGKKQPGKKNERIPGEKIRANKGRYSKKGKGYKKQGGKDRQKKKDKWNKNIKYSKMKHGQNKPKDKQMYQKKLKKQLKKKKKNENKEINEDLASRQASGGDWSSCGTTGVNDTCLTNAVEALNFAKNQINNFFKQKKRMESHDKITGNKLGKQGNFNESAEHMMMAMGGNMSNPTCGESNSTSSRSMDEAMSTYNTLNNCSESIKEACTMPNMTMNTTFLAICENVYNLSKIASDDCRTNTNYTTNGPLACNCWEKAAIGIQLAKDYGCTKYGADTAKAVKAEKKKCTAAFSACKKAEDSAVALTHTCMTGEVNTTSSRR